MAKTLKDFLNERQLGPMVVKNPDEQKFIDKHVVAKTGDRNGNGDEVFKGSKVKMADRKKEGHGYNPGEDEEVYEELKGNQHKIDANKNGKIDGHDFKLLRGKKKMKEEAEELEELSKKTLGSYINKATIQKGQHDYAAGKAMGGEEYDDVDHNLDKSDKRRAGIRKAVNKLTKEEREELEELSTPTLQSYRKKARAQGNAIVDKMKMGGGDWSKDQKDTKTLRKRAAGAQASGKQLVKRGESLKTEEAEQIDELSNKTLGSYVKKAKDQMSRSDTLAGRAMGAREMGAKPSASERKHNVRANKRYFGIDKAVDKMTKEEVQIDELDHKLGGTLSRYINKTAGDAKRQAGRDLALKKRWGDAKYGTPEPKVKAAVREDAEQVDEKLNMKKASMGTVIKDFQKSDAPQFQGKSQKKRQVMAIAAKLSAERGGKPLNKEERLLSKLADISETHKRTMVSVFEKLNEDNQRAFMQACDTAEGIEQMLDFSIQHRGE
jgi:hypothetical protein